MAKFSQSKLVLIILGLLACCLAACILSSRIPTQEGETTPDMTTPISETPQEPFSLPAPLYYLQNGQIWRLSSDTQTQQQITDEPSPVEAFDFSPANGMLVYVSNNTLVIADRDGNSRRVLQEGPDLPIIPDKRTRLNDMNHITTAIRTPLWSQDGRQVAFIENGLKIIDLETNQVEIHLENFFTYGNQLVVEDLFSWSPNGRYFLISLYQHPLENLLHRGLILFEPGQPIQSGAFRDGRHLEESGLLTYAWSPDSSQLFMADALFGWSSSLLRFEMADGDCFEIAEFVPARTYYFYAYPFVIDNENLMVFSGASQDPDEQPDIFNLYSITSQGYGYLTLRSDGYRLKDALWSPDGEGVIITLAQAGGEYQGGAALWLSTDDRPAVALPMMNTSNMRWGGNPQE